MLIFAMNNRSKSMFFMFFYRMPYLYLFTQKSPRGEPEAFSRLNYDLDQEGFHDPELPDMKIPFSLSVGPPI